MFLYWRIQQDLSCLGEYLQFHDPAMIRCMQAWIRKNYTGLTLASNQFDDENCKN